MSGNSIEECLPPLDAYKIKEFVDIMKSILRIGGTMDNGIELAEQFMTLDVDSSIQTWVGIEFTHSLFNIQKLLLSPFSVYVYAIVRSDP